MTAAIEVSDLHKSYGSVEAVRGVSFEVQPGEVFGLLGPNGAGKTTTVEILEGYRDRSGGEVRVLGHDPEQRDRHLQERVGIVLQSSGFYPRVTVREAVSHFAKAYSAPRDPDDEGSFAFGLDLLLDGFERLLDESPDREARSKKGKRKRRG